MGWIDSLRGNIVGLDTAPLIYFIEESPVYARVVDPFFEALQHGEFAAVTSVMSLLEALVVPLQRGDTDLARKYRDILSKTRGLTTMSIFSSIAEEAAKLRASYNIRTPDAIQMATATSARAKFFLTNDKRLPSLPGLQVLVLDDLKEDS
jgi:predicted nucleic acid-binding protein